LHHPSIDMHEAVLAAAQLPVVTAAYDTVASNKGALDGAQSLYLPTFAVQATGSYQAVRNNVQPDWATTGSAYGLLTVSQTIYDPTIAPKIRTARHNMENAAWLAEQAKRDAGEEASRAVLGMSAAMATLEAARKAAEDAAKVLAVVQARYVQGLTSPLEVIDAETADADARTQVAQSELADALAVVRLCFAVGRPVQEES
jgi:outer membrane protein TolC